MGKRGPKRNEAQRLADRQEAARLRRNKKTLREISGVTGVSHVQVRADLAFIDKQLLEDAKDDMLVVKHQAVSKLRQAQIEAYNAWKASQEDSFKQADEVSEKGFKTTTTTEKQSGASGHMANYLKAVEAEAKLLGLSELGQGKGDEAAQRILEMTEMLAAMRAASE
jgi:hypothetical protein